MVERFERFSVAISEISRCWHKLASEEMRPYGLKGAHALYLTTLQRYPQGITIPELCELCLKDKSDASRMLAILEEKGLVENVETFKEQLIVERNADDRNRVDVLAPPDLVNQFRIFACLTRFVL